jgi:hypothetical protein
MTVLNPIRRVDERIMDDADLAGPLLFIICFGIFLLFVGVHRVMSLVTARLIFLCSPESLSLDTFMASASLALYPYTRFSI